MAAQQLATLVLGVAAVTVADAALVSHHLQLLGALTAPAAAMRAARVVALRSTAYPPAVGNVRWREW